MSIDGTYKVSVKTPVGPQEGILVLITDGTSLSGTLDNPKGKSEFSDGTVSGNEVRFTTRIRTPLGRLKAEITGIVDGDRFSGNARLPLGNASIDGIRL
ncbi:MAG TPA: hypothetical protein VIL84_07095 [Devosiaceae bacterium]